MGPAEYMPMFLAEAREHLQELNLAIVALEDGSQDRPKVDAIFRIAHSLKGMSATMGFAAFARLTHEMEEVFELLRRRSEGLPRAAIDTLLSCLDALSASLDSIEADGSERLAPEELIDRLHGLVRARDTEPQHPATAAAAAVARAREPGRHVLHVVATFRPQTLMPAVRAHMVLMAIAEHGELIGSIPAAAEAELFEGSEIHAWLISDHEEEAVAAAAASVLDVDDVRVEAEPRSATGSSTETELEPEPAPAAPAVARASSGVASTVRVDAGRLDLLMHAMGELVIHRTAVEALVADLDVPGLQHAVQELNRSSQALQEMVTQVRMIPVDVVFLRLPRLVRDLSAQLGKEVRLELIGRDTELDRTVVDALGDPLVHLVRNALDHGLEVPAERRAAGKPPEGTLEISARHAGGSVVIEVRDDGRGIDPDRIGRTAVRRGLTDAAAAAELDVRGAMELLFSPGFSTAETTSDISGRGVGMDAVRTRVRELGGEVLLESAPGEGTVARIRLPLTLAIVSTLQVDVGGDPYAIPLDRVERTLRPAEQNVRSVAGRRMLVLEDGVLPLCEGARAFGRPAGEHPFVVVVRAGEQRLALAVDELVGQRELVTRPLPAAAAGGEPVSGGAALADGRIALIVDCDALAALAFAPPTRPVSPAAGPAVLAA